MCKICHDGEADVKRSDKPFDIKSNNSTIEKDSYLNAMV